MIVNLSSAVSVNPDHVVSVTRDFHQRYVLVKDITGATHEIGCDYGKSIFDTEERVLALLNQKES